MKKSPIDRITIHFDRKIKIEDIDEISVITCRGYSSVRDIQGNGTKMITFFLRTPIE